MGQADEVELVRSARLREHRTLDTPRGCAKDIQCYLDIYIYILTYIWVSIMSKYVASQYIYHISIYIYPQAPSFATVTKYPTDQHCSLICSQAVRTDPNFTAACLQGPEIGAVQATSWWNHPAHSHKTLAQCS